MKSITGGKPVRADLDRVPRKPHVVLIRTSGT